MTTRALYLWLALVLTGCLDNQAVTCADGTLCPANKVCVPGGCALPEQLNACMDAADGTACMFDGTSGACASGVCVGNTCGNGSVELGEVCDDGNRTSGDGCRQDCGKVELCGDEIVDEGEACDDGNTSSADGCDGCRQTAWLAQPVIGGGQLAATTSFRSMNALAVDLAGNRYVADGGAAYVYRISTNGIVTVIAGTGTQGHSGDGGPATAAQIDLPQALAVDGLGNVYIVEAAQNCVRRVDPFGIITTIAGGIQSSGGDGGAAVLAGLFGPGDVAVDGLGQVYIADTNNNRVRKIDAMGIITTVAGTTQGFAGDGGPATSAMLDHPSKIAIDGANNLYILDLNNLRIRRVSSTGTITTVAGDGSLTFTADGMLATSGGIGPLFLDAAASGDLYITEGRRVRKISTSGIVTTLAGSTVAGSTGDGGPALAATFNSLRGIARAPDGSLHVIDVDRVRTIDGAGTITSTAGTGLPAYADLGGAATAARLGVFDAIAADSAGNVYVAAATQHVVKRIEPDGRITALAGTGFSGYSGDGGPATAAELYKPTAVAVDGEGRVYIADSSNNRIRRIDTLGIITTIAGTGTAGFSGDGGPATSAQLSGPSDLAFDAAGNLYIADWLNMRIRRIDAAGIITTFAGNGTDNVSGDGGPATSAAIGGVDALAFDTQGNLYLATSIYNRVRKVSPGGTITKVAGTGTAGFSGDGGQATLAKLYQPIDITTDAADNLYIADRVNGRVRKVTSAGVISTLLGNGVSNLAGDGGPIALSAQRGPHGVAMDAAGDLLVLDSPLMQRISGGVTRTIAGEIDPAGTGPLGRGRLADPQAFVRTPAFTLFAGGTSGTLERVRMDRDWLEVVAGRHPQNTPTSNLARYRDKTFGTVGGVAYDETANVIYVSETSAHRIHAITPVDPADASTWTIASLANAAGTAGFANGAASNARFRSPTGLYFDAATHTLYVADTGNHAIRAIDLSTGVANATVTTVAGTPATLGYAGDGGVATAALLYSPTALTACPNGDLFVADTGNHRVRRISSGTISTVLGDGIATSSGSGAPAASFPVRAPRGLACDAAGNLFVTSTTTVRLLAASATGVVDGTGPVGTIYGAAPRDSFPSNVTSCLSGIAVVDGQTVQVADACSGLLIELQRTTL